MSLDPIPGVCVCVLSKRTRARSTISYMYMTPNKLTSHRSFLALDRLGRVFASQFMLDVGLYVIENKSNEVNLILIHLTNISA